MVAFAPFVYGRTLEVDFRTIAAPHDFTPTDIRLTEKYVLAALSSPEYLRGEPRWVFWKESTYCVFGIAAMVDDLLKPITPEQDRYTKDTFGRPLYGFWGYVGRIADLDPISLAVPSYETIQDLALFRKLYQYVISQWEKKIFQVRTGDATSTEYSNLDRDKHNDSKPIPATTMQLNILSDQIFCWPDDAFIRNQLWSESLKSSQNISLCMGFPRQQIGLKGPFLNVIAKDVTQFKIIKIARQTEKTSSVSPRSKDDYETTQDPMKENINHGPVVLPLQQTNEPPRQNRVQIYASILSGVLVWMLTRRLPIGIGIALAVWFFMGQPKSSNNKKLSPTHQNDDTKESEPSEPIVKEPVVPDSSPPITSRSDWNGMEGFKPKAKTQDADKSAIKKNKDWF